MGLDILGKLQNPLFLQWKMRFWCYESDVQPMSKISNYSLQRLFTVNECQKCTKNLSNQGSGQVLVLALALALVLVLGLVLVLVLVLVLSTQYSVLSTQYSVLST